MSFRKRTGSFMERADTFNMDTRRLQKPVVLERSERRREMLTTKPLLALDEGQVSAQSSETEKFHEGYVDGKLYLVPDSNLEAMKDIINLKMRRLESRRYLGEEGMTGEAMRRYDNKKEELLKKLDELGLEPETEEEEGEKEMEEVSPETEEDVGVEEEKTTDPEEKEGKEEEVEEVEEEYAEEVEEEEHDKEEEKEALIDEESKDEGETEIAEEVAEQVAKGSEEETIFPGQFYNPDVQRFLISGHFRTNRKPIYIIQRYAGPSVFGSKDPKFYSQKTDKDVCIFIAGEFYKETILEEDENQQPKMLNTRPRKIWVDESSLIREDEFSETFVGVDLDVTLVGRFIKHLSNEVHQGWTLYTPLLTISMKKGSGPLVKSRQGNKGEAYTPVFMSKPLVQNIFERGKKEKKSKPQKHFSPDAIDNRASKKRKRPASVYTARPVVDSIFEKEKKSHETAALKPEAPSCRQSGDDQDDPSKRNMSKRRSPSKLNVKRNRAGYNSGDTSGSWMAMFLPLIKVSHKQSERDGKMLTARSAKKRDCFSDSKNVPEVVGRKSSGKNSSEKTLDIEKEEQAVGKGMGKKKKTESKPLTLSAKSDVTGPTIINLEEKSIIDRENKNKREIHKHCGAGKLLSRLFSN